MAHASIRRLGYEYTRHIMLNLVQGKIRYECPARVYIFEMRSNQAPNNATHKQNKRHMNKSKQNATRNQRTRKTYKKTITDSNVI